MFRYSERYSTPAGWLLLKEKLLKSLLDLKDVKYTDYYVAQKSIGKAEKALILLFQVGKKNIIFTEKEKTELGNLLIDVFDAIKKNIEYSAFRSRTRLQLSVLMKRSAVQFLIEKYGEFPAKDSTLKSELEKRDIKKCIEDLDEIMEKYCVYSDSSEEDSDPNNAGLYDIPATHTWWFEYV